EDEEENLGMEDKTKEFKSSFIFPADKTQHMSANMKLQSRNVFKGICAFLNSMIGGTLYLGVNDRGYVIGLDNDLDQIKGSLDSYIRLIQDEAKQAFEQSILDFLDFEVMFEGRVVAIKVRPYPDGLVYMDKIPYKRNFGESEQMREDEKARMISLKMSSANADVGKLGMIEKAIVDKKCVCLKRYSSANGIRDRHVEPFKVTGSGKFVWCYDLEDRKCKQFSISRAADIILLNEIWTHQKDHKALDTDIFNWSGDRAMHIEIQMDNLACNILKDEYPLSDRYLTAVKGEEWILSTDVYRCEAPGRFVIGLLDHVKILQGDELQKYVDDYLNSHFNTSMNKTAGI
ncbi:MAG: RNA-binding domain-containing protein, partial [Candidatus Cryptobacteroides sp.]